MQVPIVLKGVQTAEDALLAYDAHLAGVVLSNHGGRQLDFARSGIEVLVEVVDAFKKRRVSFPNRKFDLFIDGGVRRASDVLKAVALGATAGTYSYRRSILNLMATRIPIVGIGRPFLYAFSTYGTEGVDHALTILEKEFEMNMRLLGARNMSEVVPSMVDARNIASHVGGVPSDKLYENNCKRLIDV